MKVKVEGPVFWACEGLKLEAGEHEVDLDELDSADVSALGCAIRAAVGVSILEADGFLAGAHADSLSAGIEDDEKSLAFKEAVDRAVAGSFAERDEAIRSGEIVCSSPEDPEPCRAGFCECAQFINAARESAAADLVGGER